jgi:hypothetical protein
MYKARWVVKGYIQNDEYLETFASVVKPMSYKALFTIAAANDYEVKQMDVKTAFLYSDMPDDQLVYMEQPEGYADGTNDVCLLLKAIYGLKQSPALWYATLLGFLKGLGYSVLDADMSVFVKGTTFVAVYVDDLLIVGPHMEQINKLKQSLSSRFKMTDLGPCNYYLGLTIRRDRTNKAIYLG